MDVVPLTEVAKKSQRFVTLREFMAFYLMEHHAEPWCSFLHLCGGLFQEWIVLQWAKIEQQKLLWLKLNQSKIRADTYSQVRVAASQGSQSAQSSSTPTICNVERRVVMPATYVGGPRFMNQLYHDGMAIVRKHGKADMFITFTANPN